MKPKVKNILLVLIGVVIGIVLACVGYAFLYNGSYYDWKKYVDETVVPAVTMAGGAISIIIALAIPIVNKINTAASLFGSATSDVKKTADAGKTVVETVADYGGQVKMLSTSFSEYKAEVDAKFEEMKKNDERMQRMLEIGFGNDEYLVKNGYARQILALKDGGKNNGQE